MRNIDGTLTLISDNPLYPPKNIDRADLPQTAIIGRVVYAFNGRNI
jgi:phage repressor protein C with HTH and peptisase S24 domain